MSDDALMRRWRLALGAPEGEDPARPRLSPSDLDMDRALTQLYEASADRTGGLGGSAPKVSRWLGDIRKYFPASVVRVLQRDALDRLGLGRMLLEPELLASVEPDVHLAAQLVALRSAIPEKSRETARQVVRKVVEDLEKRLAEPLRQAVRGSLLRGTRNNRPRPSEVDWNRTIRENLKNWQPDRQRLVVDRLVGHASRRKSLREVVLCVDQSGSMASSVVYAGVFGAVLASLPSVRTRVVAFDTEVADLTDLLSDPVDLLFGIQLGGGTDIDRALAYCQGRITAPAQTILVLISDLFEGGNKESMLRRAAHLAGSGVRMVALLALSDQGHPSYDHDVAAKLASLGVPAFACTPDRFPELMGAALSGRDLSGFAEA